MRCVRKRPSYLGFRSGGPDLNGGKWLETAALEDAYDLSVSITGHAKCLRKYLYERADYEGTVGV